MGRPKKTNDLVDSAANDPSKSGPRKFPVFYPHAEFLDFARNYQPNHGVMYYLYRLWPRIDLKLVGKKHTNLIKSPDIEDYTDQAILEKWGSGKYRVCMSDAHRKPANIAETTFKLDHMDFEPAFEHQGKELDLGHEDNRSFVQTLRIKKLLPGQQEEMMGDQPSATSTLATALVEATKTKRDNASSVTDAIALADKIAGSRADPFELALKMSEMRAKPDGTGVELLVKSLQMQNEMLMKLVFENKGARAENPMETYAKMDEVIERIASRRGGGATPGWVEELGKIALPFILARMMPAAGGGAQPPADAPRPAAPGAALPSAGEEETMAMKLVEVIPKALQAFKDGDTGDEFAHGMVTWMEGGEKLWGLLNSMGENMILLTLQQSPQWAELQSREAEVREFIRSFIAYGADPESPDPASPAEGS